MNYYSSSCRGTSSLGRAAAAVGIALLSLTACLGTEPGEPLEPADLPKVERARIRFSDQFAKRIGLKTAPVTQASVVPSLSVVGTVTFDPQRVAHVGTRLRGLVREVHHFE